jgi:AraC family transcriptional regulator of adaptative response / DNA-3-methyladenine glycosylase II
LNGIAGIVEVRPVQGKNQLSLRISPGVSGHLMQIVARVRRMFDLGADPEGINLHLSQDPFLQPLVQSNPGLRVPGAWDGFEVAVRAILGQQISVPAARTLADRLVKAYGEPISGYEQTGLRRVFPKPESLAGSSLVEIGMPVKRKETIRSLAQAVIEGEIDLTVSAGLEEFAKDLLRIPGIGDWTSQYIALRLSEPDAFPAGDLGLLQAATEPVEPLITEKNLLQRAETWRPWRAYAAVHLWGSLPRGKRTLDIEINKLPVNEGRYGSQEAK